MASELVDPPVASSLRLLARLAIHRAMDSGMSQPGAFVRQLAYMADPTLPGPRHAHRERAVHSAGRTKREWGLPTPAYE